MLYSISYDIHDDENYTKNRDAIVKAIEGLKPFMKTTESFYIVNTLVSYNAPGLYAYIKEQCDNKEVWKKLVIIKLYEPLDWAGVHSNEVVSS